MKRHELIDYLRRHGCRLEREGARHTIYANPVNDAKAPVPRHNEIDNRLARKILQPACGTSDPLTYKLRRFIPAAPA